MCEGPIGPLGEHHKASGHAIPSHVHHNQLCSPFITSQASSHCTSAGQMDKEAMATSGRVYMCAVDSSLLFKAPMITLKKINCFLHSLGRFGTAQPSASGCTGSKAAVRRNANLHRPWEVRLPSRAEPPMPALGVEALAVAPASFCLRVFSSTPSAVGTPSCSNGESCIICLDSDPPPIQSGCGCRGDAGLAHATVVSQRQWPSGR